MAKRECRLEPFNPFFHHFPLPQMSFGWYIILRCSSMKGLCKSEALHTVPSISWVHHSRFWFCMSGSNWTSINYAVALIVLRLECSVMKESNVRSWHGFRIGVMRYCVVSEMCTLLDLVKRGCKS